MEMFVFVGRSKQQVFNLSKIGVEVKRLERKNFYQPMGEKFWSNQWFKQFMCMWLVVFYF